jgi:hypothetical protein
MRLAMSGLSMLVMAACSGAAPCNACPPIDGVYAVTWADGGTASDAGLCPRSGPRVPSWTLAQRGAQVTTTIGSVNLGGTLYDSYDLLLSGSEGSTSYSLRALTIPTGTSADGGIDLRGTLTTRTVPSSGDPCEVNETFTAQRTSR